MSRTSQLEEMINYIGKILKKVPGYTLKEGMKIFWRYKGEIGVDFKELYEECVELDTNSKGLWTLLFSNPQNALQTIAIYNSSIKFANDVIKEFDKLIKNYEPNYGEGIERKAKLGQVELDINGTVRPQFDYEDEDAPAKYVGPELSVNTFINLPNKQHIYGYINQTGEQITKQLQNEIINRTKQFAFLGVLVNSLPNFQNLFTI